MLKTFRKIWECVCTIIKVVKTQIIFLLLLQIKFNYSLACDFVCCRIHNTRAQLESKLTKTAPHRATFVHTPVMCANNRVALNRRSWSRVDNQRKKSCGFIIAFRRDKWHCTSLFLLVCVCVLFILCVCVHLSCVFTSCRGKQRTECLELRPLAFDFRYSVLLLFRWATATSQLSSLLRPKLEERT
jgi:hypothetical protein